MHALVFHQSPKRSRWQLVGDEHIGTIQAIEKSVKKKSMPGRCLLCQPRVGNYIIREGAMYHLEHW